MQSASDSLAVPVAMSALMPSSAADVEAVCERIRRETSTLVQVANINSREQVRRVLSLVCSMCNYQLLSCFPADCD